MGAAVGVETAKPADGSDLLTLEGARNEILHLRKTLGHLAKDNGFAEVVYDGSDLILGLDEGADFARCKEEVVHIRGCLRLSTQNAKRRNRVAYAPTSFFDDTGGDEEGGEDEDEKNSDSDSDSDEGGEDTATQKFVSTDHLSPAVTAHKLQPNSIDSNPSAEGR